MRETTPPPSRQSDAFAHVALPVPLASAFTYKIPQELRDKVFLGCRVEVPFGHRVLSGIIVDFSDSTDLPRTKPIRQIYQTYLSDSLLKLTKWIASYYGCSIGEAAQSVLPPLLKPSRRSRPLSGMLRLTPRARDETAVADALKRSRRQRELVQRLAEGTGAAFIDEVMDWGFSTSQVRMLLDKGIVEIEKVTSASPLESIEAPVNELNAAQQHALDRTIAQITRGTFAPILVHGVTGSGKTELYIRAAHHVIEDGGGCVVLVPEIGLLPQAIARYQRVFGDGIAILHSRLSGPERFAMWRKIEQGECRIVLGPRSAVFSPVKNLRLIIVDEEQDDSYKQDDKPRYHARSVALMRGKFENLTVILGSATPSAETLHHANAGRYQRLSLPDRVGGNVLPDIHFVDMRTANLDGAFFSSQLLERIETNLSRGHQSILFLNKRGHARFVQCNACGWVARCPNCDISLTFHRVINRMKCHFCGHSAKTVARCAECESSRLYFAGVGTQRIEMDLTAFFPGVGILRMDADTTAGKEGHRRVLERFSSGQYPILIGTQMVTKGHHFPDVNLVGVLFAEESLHYPDFRASERTFQQLTQVAGRAGRGSARGEVVVQTFVPEHHVFTYLASHDYGGFMAEELKIRRQLKYPPFSRIVLAGFSAAKEGVLERVVHAWAERVRQRLKQRDIDVLGPAAPLVARIRNRYRQQVLLKGDLTAADKNGALVDFRELADAIPGGRTVDLRWDVDPEMFG